ncbi:MAG TPA: insulinase family protein, partial [Woeseiaceae bacterium]|nr:insulinase family protein [Woeseiaceae bacterium]
MRFLTAVLNLIVASSALPALAQDELPIPDIPYEKFVLDNGLSVVIHEDHKAPIVAVEIWYHVGSKNEVRGKTGFAHLFEHLMFNG